MGMKMFRGLPKIKWEKDRIFRYIRGALAEGEFRIVEREPVNEPSLFPLELSFPVVAAPQGIRDRLPRLAAGHVKEESNGRPAPAPRPGSASSYDHVLEAIELLAVLLGIPFRCESAVSRVLLFDDREERSNVLSLLNILTEQEAPDNWRDRPRIEREIGGGTPGELSLSEYIDVPCGADPFATDDEEGSLKEGSIIYSLIYGTAHDSPAGVQSMEILNRRVFNSPRPDLGTAEEKDLFTKELHRIREKVLDGAKEPDRKADMGRLFDHCRGRALPSGEWNPAAALARLRDFLKGSGISLTDMTNSYEYEGPGEKPFIYKMQMRNKDTISAIYDLFRLLSVLEKVPCKEGMPVGDKLIIYDKEGRFFKEMLTLAENTKERAQREVTPLSEEESDRVLILSAFSCPVRIEEKELGPGIELQFIQEGASPLQSESMGRLLWRFFYDGRAMFPDKDTAREFRKRLEVAITGQFARMIQ